VRPLKKLKIALLKALVHTLGRTSEGVRIAFADGFTSGVMLDYVYQNQPSGRWLIGRWLDRILLSHPGWKAIRVRKRNLEHLLRNALVLQRRQGRSPVVLDVASGPARYLLDVMAEGGADDVRAVCCDLDPDSLELGRRHAAARGLDGVHFTTGDAMSAESLAEVEPAPNLAVSSGFYDWITDDDVVRRSMALIHDLLPPGGGFLFTNQSGHVDLEMIHAIFVDFNGEPLRMVTRPADQINAWARDAGFQLVQTLGDATDNYSVTLAQRE